jgi:D-alanyl-D-alanine carboxypeptidase/D-alanyl-D-alanine-endopeptidase (penicillin-binding protein 4)
MKNLFKILTVLMVFMLSINSSFAFSQTKLDKFLKSTNLNDTSTLAISIKNVDKDTVVFEQNQNKLLHPASTLKVFTTYVALESLGYDYSFSTGFYKDSANNLYIKLGADPLLTTSQLKSAIEKLKEKGYTSFKNVYFDDSIIDKKEFAPGWMWDDDMNAYTPKVSAYNLDGNVVKVNMANSQDGMISTTLKTNYPMSVVSNLQAGAKKDYIEINRYNWTNPEVVEIIGTVTTPRTLSVPISSMRRYFIYNLQKVFDDNKITVSGTLFASKLLPNNAQLLTEITNPIKNVIPSILQNSNNLMAESVFKLAASKKYNATGTDELASYMFKEFYQNNGLKTDTIIVKDGCGVSRNNLMSASWMTDALNKLYKMQDFYKFKEYMAQSGDGTLTNRLYNMRGEAWLKTGSLSNISAIAGYVKSQDGNTYSVAILTQNFIEEQPKIKSFEDEIIEIIYNR